MILIYAGVSKLLFRLKCQGGGSIVVYLDGRTVSEIRNASLKDKQPTRGLKMLREDMRYPLELSRPEALASVRLLDSRLEY
jgi:hypothetical protein